MADDFYELLEVSRHATEDEIKRAYRRLARELHPDARPDDPDAEERFKAITVAYETLRDPERRRRYDTFGPEGLRGAAGDQFANFGGGLGDIFDAFFGGNSGFGSGRGRRAGPPRGSDAELVLRLEFTEAVFGAEKEVRVRTHVACEDCGGSGARAGTTPTTCSACGGAGEVTRVRQSILGQMMTSAPCTRCGATGEEVSSPCPACRGDGRVNDERSYKVDVPAGVDDGATLRLAGRGPAGPRGGPAGDLYVHLRVAPHERFTRQGYDLVHSLSIPVTQAALGAHFTFETLDGDEELVIPAGTQSARVFRLRGRGVPHLDGRGRGDLLVEVVVEVPTDLTSRQESLLRELAEERGEEVAPADTSLFGRIRSAFR